MKLNLNIKGMHCNSCAVLISDALENLGVQQSKIDAESGKAVIHFDEKKITAEKIKQAIKKEGYKVE